VFGHLGCNVRKTDFALELITSLSRPRSKPSKKLADTGDEVLQPRRLYATTSASVVILQYSRERKLAFPFPAVIYFSL
jgi:hypothetical protein